jgi:proteasome lid subunit RPN8/RPN11
MKIMVPRELLEEIHAHGEESYPEEGAGLLLGEHEKDQREVKSILPLTNAREQAERHHRYLLTAEDMVYGEEVAEKRDQSIVGIFHSHPDHPDRPSEFDREWAIPWYSYLITSVHDGRASGSRSWRLKDDRSGFEKETLQVD